MCRIKHPRIGKVVILSVIGLLLLATVTVLSGCSSSSSASTSSPVSSVPTNSGQATSSATKTIHMRLSNGLAIGTYQNETLIPYFIQQIQQKTNGAVTIQNFPAGQLYGHIQTADAVHKGAIEMGFNATDQFTGYTPVMGYGAIQFLFPSIQSWEKDYNDLYNLTDKMLNAIGVKLICLVPYSSNTLISNTLIEKPADCKGLKIRGPDQPFFDAIKAWGGVPTSLPPDQCYDAISKGTISAILSGWDSAQARKFYEVAKYYAGPTGPAIWMFVMNLNTWNSLPKDIQADFQSVATATATKAATDQVKSDQDSIAFLKSKGMNVIVFNANENTVWKAASQPAWDEFLKRGQAAGQGDIAQQILNLGKAASP